MKIGPNSPGQATTARPIEPDRPGVSAQGTSLQPRAASRSIAARPVSTIAQARADELHEARLLALALPATQWPLIIGERISDILARGDA